MCHTESAHNLISALIIIMHQESCTVRSWAEENNNDGANIDVDSDMATNINQHQSANKDDEDDEDDDDGADDKYCHPFTKRHHLRLAANLVYSWRQESHQRAAALMQWIFFFISSSFFACVSKQTPFVDTIVSKTRIRRMYQMKPNRYRIDLNLKWKWQCWIASRTKIMEWDREKNVRT